MPASFLTLTAAAARDHEAAAPDVREINHEVLVTTRLLFATQPGKRRAAITAAWKAATGSEAWPAAGDARAELGTYRQIEHELRTQLRATLGRAAETEPDPHVQVELGRSLQKLSGYEAITTCLAARSAVVVARRRRRR